MQPAALKEVAQVLHTLLAHCQTLGVPFGRDAASPSLLKERFRKKERKKERKRALHSMMSWIE